MFKTRSRRFLLAGGINTAVGLLLYPLLQTILGPLGVHYLATLVVCHFLCVIQAYVLGRWYVFNSQQKPLWEFFFFSTFQWGYFGFNLIFLPVAIHFSNYDPRVVQLGFSIVATICSYFWQTHVVFRTPRV